MNSRVLDVSNELKDAKLKISKLEEIEKFRVEQINKWEKESLEKESELAKATTTILNQQNKLDSLSKDKWEKVEFTNDCKKDINILPLLIIISNPNSMIPWLKTLKENGNEEVNIFILDCIIRMYLVYIEA